jgi:predicted ATP-grasp superfamily ATP-dependent carboligase
MRYFVYEYLTATGIGREPGSPGHGMYLEGRAMRYAITRDLECTNAEAVFAFPETATPVREEWFAEAARHSDYTIVIAPETDSILLNAANLVEEAGGKLLGCSLEAIRLTSDKLTLAQWWRAHGVRTPPTSEREPTACELFPVVWKPRDGAGSTDTFLIRDRFELAQALAASKSAHAMILQEFVPGQAASVAFLCGPTARVPLLPASQLLSDDGRFAYRGGELPLPEPLAARAVKIASDAIACVPGLLGYVGVDVVLGDAPDGSRDYAIEINPRLTTSYIGIRELANFNIAHAMLQIARDEPTPAMQWKRDRVRFAASGDVRWVS